MDWGNIPASKLLPYIFVFGILINSFCTTFIDAYSLQSRTEQLSKITHYDIITPKRLDGRYRRDATTLQEDGHLKTPSFILPIEGEEYILDLHLNEMLFADGFIERTYTEELIPIDKLPHRTHHCYYHGEVRGSNSSLVALSTCDGLSGLIHMDGDTFYLEPLHGSSSEHLIYRSEHMIRDKPLHTFEEDYPKDFIEKGKRRMEEIEMRHRERVRRNTEEEVKYIELVMVADSKLYERFGTINKVNRECKDIANIMDLIYVQLNTRVALASVVIWTTDPFVVSSNPSTALGQFQRWREKELVPAISHDNAQLITGLNFDGSTVGMAALGTMCSRDQSCGVSQDHGNHANDVASTISHELGHNLGLNHDSGKDCDCDSPPNVGCVMSASSGSNPPLNWSSCSRDEFRQSLNRGLGACMFNYPKVIFQGPICQNGFLEEGEECDCGPADICDNPCCVAETCRLHENATCAIGACCENCQLKERGNLCRPMMNECDLPEYCSGTDEECPGNVYRQNGVSCNHAISDIASCFNGMCMSYDDQCSYIWGEGATVAHPKCWRYNQQGNSFGNCGYDANGAVSCKKDDKMCGKLLCEGGAGFPILSSLASASQGFIWDENGAKRVCKAASLDQGEDIPDPGYVADGSPCAANMFCYERECINHTRAGIVSCPENCNGNGICNSENHCHCNDNWDPPTCSGPGHGGSVDSGPTMPIPPEILTTEKLASTPPHHTSPPIQHGTGYSVSCLPSTTSISPTTPFYASPGSNMSFSSVVMISLVVLAAVALVLLMTLLFWKRKSISGRFKLQTISNPKHPPPARPTSQRGITKVVIEHPDHISEAPPSYESHYRNLGDQLSPVRVAPAPPSKPEQRQMWDNDSPVFFPAIKYQKKDDAVMYDEPPNVTCVDPSIPRFNPPPSPPAKPEKPRSPFERPRPVSLRSNSIEGPKPVHNEPPTPPFKPDNAVAGLQFRLPSTGEEAEPISPVRVAPKPPSFTSEIKDDIKPAGQEILKPMNQTPLKPPSQVPPKPPSQAPMKPPVQAPPKPPSQTPLKPPGQTPPKPPGQTPPKPPGQTPPKPPGQTPPKPSGQTPLKPPSQTPLKPPGQTPLKPVVENHSEPSVLPSSKPLPPPKKPAVSSKPAVSNKPAISSKPVPTAAPRPALRPVRQQNNLNNSASSSSSSVERDNIDENTEKLQSSFGGGLKPSVAPPEPPKKPSEVKVSAKPPPPPKPAAV